MADRGWTEVFGALREREFERLLTGQVVSTTGEAMIPVALAFAVLDMTDSPTDVGIVLAAGVVPVVLFLLLGGIWADRLPRQRVMMGADLARAAAQAVLALLLLSGRATVPEIVLLQAARGTAWNWLGLLVFFPLGLVLAGPVSRLIGVSETLWVSAATILLLALIGLAVPSMRNLPSRAAMEEAARAARAARAGEAERSAEPVVRQKRDA